MIHVIDNPLAPEVRPLLQSMFADRKRLFIDLFGWDVPVVDGQYEIDQFDTADAIYLIAEEEKESGVHAASLRLLPTTKPHMLGTVFRHLCPLGVPEGGGIWESTRLCLPQRHGAARRKVLRNQLISAMVDVALARGVHHYTGLLPEAFRKEVLAMGWKGEPLGPVVRMPGGPIGAFMVQIDADTPRRLCWTQTYVGNGGEVKA